MYLVLHFLKIILSHESHMIHSSNHFLEKMGFLKIYVGRGGGGGRKHMRAIFCSAEFGIAYICQNVCLIQNGQKWKGSNHTFLTVLVEAKGKSFTWIIYIICLSLPFQYHHSKSSRHIPSFDIGKVGFHLLILAALLCQINVFNTINLFCRRKLEHFQVRVGGGSILYHLYSSLFFCIIFIIFIFQKCITIFWTLKVFDLKTRGFVPIEVQLHCRQKD